MFQSAIGEMEHRICTSCGRDPSIGHEPLALLPQPAPQAIFSGSEDRQRHKKVKRSRSHKLFKAAWLLFFSLLGIGIYLLNRAGHKNSEYAATYTPPPSKISGEDALLLGEAATHFQQTFAGFLSATTPEQRSQFVYQPIRTIGRMACFYGDDPAAKIDLRTLAFSKSAVVHLPGCRVVETLWRTADSRDIDATFVEENGEWRLDWEHFVRFSDRPWGLFLAGNGEEQGEFRLLARLRLAQNANDTKNLSIVFYTPRNGQAGETSNQSPEFLVKRDSENGKLLSAAFELEKKKERPYHVYLPSIDPDGFIRVHAIIKRTDINRVREFEILQILACDWYGEISPPATPAEAQPMRLEK